MFQMLELAKGCWSGLRVAGGLLGGGVVVDVADPVTPFVSGPTSVPTGSSSGAPQATPQERTARRARAETPVESEVVFMGGDIATHAPPGRTDRHVE
jgi:hypothetical protein